MPRTLLTLMAALALSALAGCADLHYYWQSVHGHVQLMQAAVPLQEWLQRPDLAAPLRTRLLLAQRARAFAVAELGLPDNASYHRYAQLPRTAAVWNVAAAPPDALTPHTWCFIVTGCITYRGYFAKSDAHAEAAQLAAQGLEVNVYGVPAYSTLGYLNWTGGDPLLSTFIGWPEGEFVRLLFHELAHQVVYVAGDTAFNESFATAVERLGSARWLATQSTPQARQDFAASQERRLAWQALTRLTRAQLTALYGSNQALALAPQALAAMKNDIMQDFRARYAVLRSHWQAPAAQLAGYDRWVAEANNASFAVQAAYDDGVPAFMALFEQQGGDWPRFYAAVQQLARLPAAQRQQALKNLTPETTPHA